MNEKKKSSPAPENGLITSALMALQNSFTLCDTTFKGKYEREERFISEL